MRAETARPRVVEESSAPRRAMGAKPRAHIFRTSEHVKAPPPRIEVTQSHRHYLPYLLHPGYLLVLRQQREETNMTRISSLAVDYYHAAKKKKIRTAAISGLVIAAVIICFALINESGSAADTASESGAKVVAAGQPATADSINIVVSDGGGDAASSHQAGAKSPPGDLRGAIRTETAEDFDPDAAAGEDHEGEYPDGVVVAEDDKERQYGDDYTDDVAGGLVEGGGDDDEFLLDSPDGPPTDDMMDDGIAEEV